MTLKIDNSYINNLIKTLQKQSTPTGTNEKTARTAIDILRQATESNITMQLDDLHISVLDLSEPTKNDLFAAIAKHAMKNQNFPPHLLNVLVDALIKTKRTDFEKGEETYTPFLYLFSLLPPEDRTKESIQYLVKAMTEQNWFEWEDEDQQEKTLANLPQLELIAPQRMKDVFRLVAEDPNVAQYCNANIFFALKSADPTILTDSHAILKARLAANIAKPEEVAALSRMLIENAKSFDIPENMLKQAVRFHLLDMMDKRACPKEERNELTDLMLKLLFSGTTVFDNNNIDKPFESLMSIPQADRNQFVDLILNVREKMQGLHTDFIHFISLMPKGDWSEQSIEDAVKAVITCKNAKNFYEDMLRVAPEYRREVFLLVREQPERQHNGVLFLTLRDHYPHILQASYDFLSKQMDEAAQDPKKLYGLAKIVIDNRRKLALYDVNPLVQKAVSSLAIADPKALRDPKNPYRIYQSFIQTPEPLVACVMPVENKKTVNIGELRKLGASALTFADLPTVDKTLLSNIMKSLLNPSSEEKGKQIAVYLEEEKKVDESVGLETAVNLTRMSEMLVGNFSLIKQGLGVKEKEGVIPNYLFCLYSIVDEIAHMSTTPDGTGLTPQEKAVIGLAKYLARCSTGQEEALIAYYNGMGARRAVPVMREQKEEHVVGLVNEGVQTYLDGLFNDESVLKEAIGGNIQRIDQTVHQQKYLRNRLHKQLGFRWIVSFDDSTKTIYNSLVQATPDDLVKPFVAKITPGKLVQAVLPRINQAIVNQNAILTPILEMIEKRFPDSSSQGFTVPYVKEEEYREIIKFLKERFHINQEDMDRYTAMDLDEQFDQICAEYHSAIKEDKVKEILAKRDVYILSEEGAAKLLEALNLIKGQ